MSGSRPAAPPAIEVVIPTRDRPHTLAAAIAGVLRQSHPVARVIVVSDAADLPALPSTPGVAVVRNRHAPGAPGARNTGLDLVTAEWVVFHDDDDEWDAGFTATVAPRLAASGPEDVAYFPAHRIRFVGGAELARAQLAGPPSVADLLRANCVGPTSFVVCRTAAVKAAGGFDPALPAAQDWDLWLRLAENGALRPLPEVLGTWVAHGGERISAAPPGERFRRYRPFLERRLAHPEAAPLREGIVDEAYWWGVLAAWSGDVAGATEAFDWTLAHAPKHARARGMRRLVASRLRRPALALLYGWRRSRMRPADSDRPLPAA